MSEPILAVDCGTTSSAAILVVDGKEEPVEEPSGRGRTWPSAVSLEGDRLVVGTAAENRKRRHPGSYRAEFKPELAAGREIKLGERSFPVPQLFTALLRAMRSEAERVAGQPVTRVVLTVPASYQPHDNRRDLMIQAATAAGFGAVELLPEPVAAGLAPATGTPVPPGSLMLIYDFGGGTFDCALVRVSAKGNQVLGYAALDDCGGRDIDTELAAQVQRQADAELAEHTATPRGRLLLNDVVTQLKHQLSQAKEADDDYGTTDIVLSSTRAEVEEITRPLIDRTLVCVQGMLSAAGTSLTDVTAVLMVGGVTRMPLVQATVANALGRPLREPKSPELAVVQGAARFAASAGARFAVPAYPRTEQRPLRWDFPDDTALLTEWLVKRGDSFDPGQPLARVRLASGSLWELRADNAPGRVLALHTERGAAVFSGDWLVTAEATDVRLNVAQVPASSALFSVPPHGVAFRPGAEEWAISIDNGNIYVRDLRKDLDKWSASAGAGNCAAAYSFDGKYLAAGNDRGQVQIWATRDGRTRSVFECGTPVTAVSFSQDGTHLATSSDCLHVWDLDTGTAVMLRAGTVRGACFSPVGGLLAAAYPADKKVRLFDVALGRDGAVVSEIYCRPAAGFTAFSADGARFAAGFDGDSAGIWETRDGQRVALFPHIALHSAAFNPDGLTFATGGDDGYARLWNIASGTEVGRVKHGAPVRAVAFSADGTLLATAGSDDFARAWQIK